MLGPFCRWESENTSCQFLTANYPESVTVFLFLSDFWSCIFIHKAAVYSRLSKNGPGK